ncbi:MAG: hypothetical protein QXL54_05080 [Candidatus Bathyarchaeia archaeon]
MKCDFCNDEAIEECDYCGRLFCKKHGDIYEPNEERICNECLTEIELREQSEYEDELFLEGEDWSKEEGEVEK